jgi:hypothetical protein
MAIDAGIFQLAGRGVKSVAEYDAEASQAKQNKLAEMMSGMKMQEYQTGVERTGRLNSLLGAFKPESTADDQVGQLTRGGFLPEARSLAESSSKVAKEKRDAEKAQLETTVQKLAIGAQLLGGVRDQASYDAARQTAQSHGLDVSRMPPAYDPAFIAQKIKEGQTVKEQLEQHWKQKGYDTPDANAVLSAQTQATGQQIQIRGQDKTDLRARDLNDTKVEENKLKREAKDDTANLTKSSQIASFDTMLGTLDRLGQHPGLKRSVGAMGVLPTMPGSDSANFQAELNTFQSQAFLPMVAQLKGMGALSDSEGKKLTAAVGALDPKMGEQAFRESVARITADMQAARQRMVGGGKPGAAAAPATRTVTRTGTLNGKKVVQYSDGTVDYAN